LHLAVRRTVRDYWRAGYWQVVAATYTFCSALLHKETAKLPAEFEMLR
jgi:hypothetical protein